MAPSLMLRCLLLAGIAASANAVAQDIVPRNADAVRPRQSEAVQSRAAEAVPSRQASTVQPRVAPMVRDTAVVGSSTKAWQWMEVDDTGIAGDGVARGSQVKNLRCAGVACRVYQDTAGAWTIRAEGGFPQASGQTLDVLVMSRQTQDQDGDSRGRGVFSDGRFWDQFDTGRLPAGSYVVFYHWKEKDQVLAAIAFDLLRHETSAGASSNRRRVDPADDAAARQKALKVARENQRCLAMAATNPDVRCVP